MHVNLLHTIHFFFSLFSWMSTFCYCLPVSKILNKCCGAQWTFFNFIISWIISTFQKKRKVSLMKLWLACQAQRIWLPQAPPWEKQPKTPLELALRSKTLEDFYQSCCYKSKVCISQLQQYILLATCSVSRGCSGSCKAVVFACIVCLWY